jgi:outer membrane protein assembly factor BamD
MANFRIKNKWFFLLMLVILGSCSPYQRLLKSDDVMLKKDKAIEYYEKGDYNRALTLLNDIIPAFRGTAHAEKLNYYYAYAHFHQKDYVMAAHYFRTFTQGFPRSEYVEEFLFMSAYCKYLLSPRHSLDQAETLDAIREFQGFINRFPNSPRVEQSNEYIDELRFKLEKKAFDSAMLYFNIRDYNAAVTSFNNVIRQFPDTQFREESLFYIIRSYFLFAENSMEFRQLERYQGVVNSHARLVNRFPESRFKAEADRMLAVSQNQIERLEANGQASIQNNN